MRIQEQVIPPHLLDADFISEVLPEMTTIKGIAPPYRLFRYDKAADRYYFRFDGGARGYLSVTSFCHKALPTSPHLIKWMTDLGSDEAVFQRDLKAEYGTLLHITITEILRNGGGNFAQISTNAFNSAIESGYKHEALDWQEEIVNDVYSYLCFYKERNVRIIGIEFPICSDTYGLAGCIDQIIELEFNKTTVRAILDLKSGRKGFWCAHKLQLHAYKEMWNEWYGDIFPVDHVFNLAPVANAMKSKSKYKLENQTDAKLDGSDVPLSNYIQDEMARAKKNGWVRPPMSHMEIRGDFSLETFNPEEHIFQVKI